MWCWIIKIDRNTWNPTWTHEQTHSEKLDKISVEAKQKQVSFHWDEVIGTEGDVIGIEGEVIGIEGDVISIEDEMIGAVRWSALRVK